MLDSALLQNSLIEVPQIQFSLHISEEFQQFYFHEYCLLLEIAAYKLHNVLEKTSLCFLN